VREAIERIFHESIEVKRAALERNAEAIEAVVEAVVRAFEGGGKVLLFGNGGSAADCQHIAAEFIGRFQKERLALPAIALTTDSSILTALGNDYSYDIVFARQVEGLARAGDVVIGISTSGGSANVVKGIQAARDRGAVTVAMSGGDGGVLARQTDIALIVPSRVTARIQESHICLAHVICELVENRFS